MELALGGDAIIADGRGESFQMLNELHERWLDSRRIDPETAIRMGLYSGRRGPDGQVAPDSSGDVLVFPYLKDGEEVGAKYRGPKKTFWQRAGGRKQFWNADILSDPALIEGREPLVIVEGEMDALAVIESGHPFVVSVPDGAPPGRDANGQLITVPDTADDIDIESDVKFSFLRTDWERLSKIRRIIIAVDADEPGQRLAAELVRRLDPVRCAFVRLQDGFKDLNEVLVRDGKQAVLDALKAAKPYPIDGLYRASDFPDQDKIVTYTTGWGSLDDKLRPYLGAFMVVGGFPGHGKSTWTMQLAVNMASLHGWGVCIASFEMMTKPYVTNSIMSTFLGESITTASQIRRNTALQFLERRFLFVAPNHANANREHDIDWLLDKLQAAVIRDGVKMVVIDPFNEIEHRRNRDESLTEYIGRAIRKLKAFALQYQVLVVVVVHPTKQAGQVDPKDLTLYSLADSSHWANKADLGVIIGRVGISPSDKVTGVYIKKVRYQPDAGMPGETTLTFEPSSRTFA